MLMNEHDTSNTDGFTISDVYMSAYVCTPRDCARECCQQNTAKMPPCLFMSINIIPWVSLN